MRILVIGDHESKSLWDFYEPSKLEDIDLIISCGDLSPRYLSFLVTMAHAPVLYIHGNHDDKYEMTPPEGCICVDDDLSRLMESAFWAWAAPCVTATAHTSTRKKKCGPASGSG